MIYVSGFFSAASQEDQQREADLYSRNGWTLKEASTHNARIIIDKKDIEAFCSYLRGLPADKKTRVYTDRDGISHDIETVSLYLKGYAADRFIRLKGSFKTSDGVMQRQQPARATTPRQAPPMPAIQQTAPVGVSPRTVYTAQQPPQPNAWNTDQQVDYSDNDIPF